MKKKNLFFILFVLCLSFSACSPAGTEADIWSEAIFAEDTELGNGEKTVVVEVVAKDKTVAFTIHSDKNTLGEAMLEHGLIEGEQGVYGLYVKKVNGITADYDENQCYWGIYKDGESLMSGVDGTEIKDGEHYEFVYTM